MSERVEGDDRTDIELALPDESSAELVGEVSTFSSQDEFVAHCRANDIPIVVDPNEHGEVEPPAPTPMTTRHRGRSWPSNEFWRSWSDELAGIPPRPISPDLIEVDESD